MNLHNVQANVCMKAYTLDSSMVQIAFYMCWIDNTRILFLQCESLNFHVRYSCKWSKSDRCMSPMPIFGRGRPTSVPTVGCLLSWCALYLKSLFMISCWMWVGDCEFSTRCVALAIAFAIVGIRIISYNLFHATHHNRNWKMSVHPLEDFHQEQHSVKHVYLRVLNEEYKFEGKHMKFTKPTTIMWTLVPYVYEVMSVQWYVKTPFLKYYL